MPAPVECGAGMIFKGVKCLGEGCGLVTVKWGAEALEIRMLCAW